MSAMRSTWSRTTMAQPLPTIAKHPFENRSGSPAASGRTARLSDGKEPNQSGLCMKTCEPPNVGHERRPQSGEAALWTSARWKG
jgi:hypothetical protein